MYSPGASNSEGRPPFSRAPLKIHPQLPLCLKFALGPHIRPTQGRSQDFVIGGAKRKFGGASLKNFKILNIGLRNFYVMFK